MVSMATEKPKRIRDLWVKPVQKDNTRFSGSKHTHSSPDNWEWGKGDEDGLWWYAHPSLEFQTMTMIGTEQGTAGKSHKKESVEDRHEQDSG